MSFMLEISITTKGRILLEIPNEFLNVSQLFFSISYNSDVYNISSVPISVKHKYIIGFFV